MSTKRKIRSAYSGHVSVKNPVVDAKTREKFRVKQEFADEVNINNIIRRMKNGTSPPQWMTSKTPMYGDFTHLPSNIQEAYDRVQQADEAFTSLPIEFRRELDHDPRNLFTAPKDLFAKHGLLNSQEAPVGDNSPQETPAHQPKGGSPKNAPKASKKLSDEPQGEE